MSARRLAAARAALLALSSPFVADMRQDRFEREAYPLVAEPWKAKANRKAMKRDRLAKRERL